MAADTVAWVMRTGHLSSQHIVRPGGEKTFCGRNIPAEDLRFKTAPVNCVSCVVFTSRHWLKTDHVLTQADVTRAVGEFLDRGGEIEILEPQVADKSIFRSGL